MRLSKGKRILLCILSLPVAMLAAAGLCFQKLDRTETLQNIWCDEMFIEYDLTSKHTLYVSGVHGDSFGLYETGLRWNKLYGLRQLFLRMYDPVLFAENVKEVFPGEDGFLYTDSDGTLYYFGNYSHHVRLKIAEHVRSAFPSAIQITYVDEQSNAYQCLLTKQPEFLDSGVRQAWSVPLVTVLLYEDGSLYLCFADVLDPAGIRENRILLDTDVKTMKCTRDAVFYTDSNGWLKTITYDTLTETTTPPAVLALHPIDYAPLWAYDVAVLTEDGTVDYVNITGKKKGAYLQYYHRVLSTDLPGQPVSICGNSDKIFILTDDGSKYQIGHTPGAWGKKDIILNWDTSGSD